MILVKVSLLYPPNVMNILSICFESLFNVQPSDFAIFLRLDMSLGVLIMTYSGPLIRVIYEVILQHPSMIW